MLNTIPHIYEFLEPKSPYTQKYLGIVSSNKSVPKGENHHIVPVAYYKYVLNCERTRLASSPDMDPSNIVRLSKQDHILAHYFLARSIIHTNALFVDSQLYAFVNMFNPKMMDGSPFLTEMSAFYEQNKSVRSRYRQHNIPNANLVDGCTAYRYAVTPNNKRIGAWIKRCVDGRDEHYAFDHFGNCIELRLEGYPSIYMERDLVDGSLLKITVAGYECGETLIFPKNRQLPYLFGGYCNGQEISHRVSPCTYDWARAVFKMQNFLKVLVAPNELKAMIDIAQPLLHEMKIKTCTPLTYRQILPPPKKFKPGKPAPIIDTKMPACNPANVSLNSITISDVCAPIEPIPMVFNPMRVPRVYAFLYRFLCP